MTLPKKLNKMAQEIDDLKTAVAASITVEEAAIVLIAGLAERLSNVTDLSELTAITADLNAEKEKLAAAITQNTPAA